MGEGYVHQGHFFRMSSHDVTNVLPWPRPGCVTSERSGPALRTGRKPPVASCPGCVVP